MGGAGGLLLRATLNNQSGRAASAPDIVRHCTKYTHNYKTKYTHNWDIPSEKIGQNIHPSESRFLSLIINTGLVQVHLGHFWPPWTLGGSGGALGGFGGPAHPKNDIIARGPF